MPTVYAAMSHAIMRASDSDGSWQTTWHEPAERFECLAASPAAPERVFAGTVESGLLRSLDGGETWETVATFGDRVTAVTVSPHDPSTIWAGTEPSQVVRSVDGGDSWTERPGLTDLPSADRWSFPPRPHTHHVRWLAVDPHEPERVYVAIEAGAFLRTADGGETWQDHPDGGRLDTHAIATHPDRPGHLYVAAGDGYAESPDGGASWTYPQSGLDHRYVWSVAVAEDDPDLVVVAAASGAPRAHDPDGTAFVYRRDGDSWQVAMDGLPGPDGTGRAVVASHDVGFYAVTNHGLFRSQRGDRWETLPVEWPTAAADHLPQGLAVVD